MCGIAGIFHLDFIKNADINVLNRMSISISHRGPDGSGVYVEGPVALAHRRLSILDLSDNGKQPFISDSGRFVILYNGEIFNFLELKMALIADGIKFKSNSDTEVLLYMYIKHGKKCLEMLNGMFAFVIWDNLEKRIFIARDRIGVKPFYYAIHENTFYFSSEPKALFAAGVPKIFDEKNIQELLLFKYVAGENTCFQNVRRLLPGHIINIIDGELKFERWWSLAEKIRINRERLPKNPYQWFEETFYSSVSYRTISDVPIGLMLSGGLDSGSIAAALHYNGNKDMAAFTVQFEEKEYNEEPLAKLVAEKFGLKYHSLSLKGSELFDSLIQASYFHDEPLIHQNDAQMLALSRYAKQYVSVLLSGEGGDEFMGGYVRYKPLQYYKSLKFAGKAIQILKYFSKNGIVNRFDKLSRYLKGNDIEELILLNASSIYPNDFKKLDFTTDLSNLKYRQAILSEASELYPAEPARQAMYTDLFIHMASVLDRNDRMTMGAGIECRVPFMDYRLMEMIPALPSNYLLKEKKGKYLLVNSVAKKLPQEVLSFKKLGFSVPWERYMKEDERFADCFNRIKAGSLRDVIGDLDVSPLFTNHIQNETVKKALLRQLLMLQIWKDINFKD
jgi:asparagine synthase (glutamine-hydrolysing)